MKCSLGISNFLEEISSLSHSIVFLYFFSLITKEGFLVSPCYSLELCIQMGISFLFSFAFHFSFLSYFKASSDSLFAFLLLEDGIDHCFRDQCYEPMSIVLQALYWISSLQSICHFLCIIIPLYNHKGFDLVIPEWSSGFPYFLPIWFRY